jgi:hypothetical protein
MHAPKPCALRLHVTIQPGRYHARLTLHEEGTELLTDVCATTDIEDAVMDAFDALQRCVH